MSQMTGFLYCYRTRKEMIEIYDRLKALDMPDAVIEKAYNQTGAPYPWTIAIICTNKEKLDIVDNILVKKNFSLGDADCYAGELRIKEFFGMMLLGTYEPGFIKIKEGYCPVNATQPTACMFCQYGHLMECHHPMTCEQTKTSKVKCSHLERYEE